jgi:hypothetical protein
MLAFLWRRCASPSSGGDTFRSIFFCFSSYAHLLTMRWASRDFSMPIREQRKHVRRAPRAQHILPRTHILTYFSWQRNHLKYFSSVRSVSFLAQAPGGDHRIWQFFFRVFLSSNWTKDIVKSLIGVYVRYSYHRYWKYYIARLIGYTVYR